MYRSSVLVVDKKSLTSEEIEKIHVDLTFPNPVYENTLTFSKFRPSPNIPKEINFYQEIDGKLILPRNYPLNPSYKITDKTCIGDPLRNFDFKGTLRKYQLDFFRTIDWRLDDICFACPCGHGKCLGKGTKVLMYDGSIKKVEDVVVGDLLMGDDSTPRKVLSLARGREQMYWIHQNKGISYRVNESHILSLKSRSTIKDSEIVDISVKDYLPKTRNWKNLHLGYNVPVEYKRKKNLIDAYLLGLWLGDGDSCHTTMTTDERDTELTDFYSEVVKRYKGQITYRTQPDNNSSRYSFVTPKGKRNPLLQLFKKEGLIGNKHIPEHYITTSRRQRLELLAGLIDTDGEYWNKNLCITQKREVLADGIERLCWSLGFRVKRSIKVVKGVGYHRLNISGKIDEIPTRLPRKKISERVIYKDPHVNSIEVVKDTVDNFYGFEIDGNKRFLLEDSTVTHNTTMGINAIYKYKVKTIVFVNTNFLVRQWTKRLKQFTTGRIHVLDSSKIDKLNIDDVDVIISTLDMFRSTLNKYPDDFDTFVATGRYSGKLEFINHLGLVEFDEAHRLGANEYEPVITSIPAKHRITLTATFRRGDGREKMLIYHFGKIYIMPNQFPNALYYGLDTELEFGHVIDKKEADKLKITELLDDYKVDYQEYKKYYEVFINWKQLKVIESEGNNKVKYKKHLDLLRTPTKTTILDNFIVTVSKRQRLVYKLLEQLLQEKRTVLVLSKRKNVLKVMHEMFSSRGYRSALVISETANGKEDELEEEMNQAQIIFGINQLAQEGLDCDNLDTVVTLHLVKDPEQLIGRTMRLKDGKKPALAIQCVDRFRPYLGIYDKSLTFAKNNADTKGLVKYETLIEEIL